jgi:Domain of unknown function (DUF4397)
MKRHTSWTRVVTRLALASLLAASLAACGGSDDDGDAQMRLINATADVASIDMTIDNDDIDETRQFSAVARDSQSDYTGVDDTSYTLRVKREGASSTLALSSAALEKDQTYTVFAYGREGDYRVYAAVDDEDEPSSGTAVVRVFNAAPDAGSVDVYLTEDTASLDDTLATVSSVGGATLSFYNSIDRGTYRLRVTALGDKDDIRLDVPGIELADKARVTIVLQPGSGGVLVNALVSQYQGSLAAVKNTYARARLVAGATGNAAVTAALGDTSLNVNLRSPSIGSYALVPAATVAANISVNTTTSVGGSVTLAPGADYTVAVYGDAAAPEWRLIADDNRPPASSERAKMRLLHMDVGVNANLTLVKDYVAVASDVAYGNASSYNQVATSSDARIEVTSPLAVAPVFLSEDVVLASQGVYTVFVLGGAATPTGILRRER